MDEFNRFYDSVLAHIPRATSKEQDEIRQELQDHLEDHRDLLLDYGMSEAEARKRAVESMGDAEEIGRAWNAHLSPVWLWVGRLSKTLCILLILAMSFPFLYQAHGVFESVTGRFESELSTRDKDGYEVLWTQEMDVRQEFGEHIIRIFETKLMETTSSSNIAAGAYCLKVSLMSYAQNPFHYVMDMDILMNHLRCNGEMPYSSGGSGNGVGYLWWSAYFPVEKGLEAAEVTLYYRGHSFCATLPLDWSDVT